MSPVELNFNWHEQCETEVNEIKTVQCVIAEQ